MLLLIDNFDSFTFNIVHALQKLQVEVCVRRNNAITIEECRKLDLDYLVIGPGPGNPKQCGISFSLINEFQGSIPILGICLGMQLIAEMFGGSVKRSSYGPMHGKTSRIYHNNLGLFHELAQGFEATRYHSLIVEKDHLPNFLEITAETDKGEIMGIKHKELSIEGVQFHPESILTTEGEKLLKNYLMMPGLKHL